MNWLINKGMSNIYLKVTIEKNWRFQNFDFLSLKNLPKGQFLRSSRSGKYYWTLKLLVETRKSEVWEQKYVWFFYYFNFKRNYDVSKLKSLCILLNKNISLNLIKTKRNRKGEIAIIVIERRTLRFSSCRDRKLKVKPGA